MKKKYLILLAVICLLIPLGCQKHNPQPMLKAGDLLHHNFILINADGKEYKLKKGKSINLEFNESMHINGAICNNYFGQAELKNNILKATLASTMMLCPEPELNQLETIFFEMMKQGAEIRLEGDKLFLNTSQHRLTYQKRDWVQ